MWPALLAQGWAMGLMPSQVERLTPGEWKCICKGEEAKQKRLDFRAALAPWVIANCNRGPKSSPIHIEEFMPREVRPQTAEDHLAMFKAITAMYGGTDERPKEAGK